MGGLKGWERKSLRPEPPMIEPTGYRGSPEAVPVFEALQEAFYENEDDRYPPHNEEAFQEGYPRKGTGRYGSPGEF